MWRQTIVSISVQNAFQNFHLGLARKRSCANLLALNRLGSSPCARVAELADALDSGSSE